LPGIDDCLTEAMTITGALGASLVDWTSGLALGAVGAGPGGDHDTGAADATEVARAITQTSSFADPAARTAPADDVIITSAGSYHLIRFIETAFDSSVFLYLRLDRATANLAMARLRLASIVEGLVIA
jgi:hypothetical protein